MVSSRPSHGSLRGVRDAKYMPQGRCVGASPTSLECSPQLMVGTLPDCPVPSFLLGVSELLPSDASCPSIIEDRCPPPGDLQDSVTQVSFSSSKPGRTHWLQVVSSSPTCLGFFASLSLDGATASFCFHSIGHCVNPTVF